MIEEKLVSEIPSQNIGNKKSSLQFLPEALQSLSQNKFIEFKDRKLKTSYVVDIVHNLLLKYYFKKENSFSLSSIVLKDKYGYLYNFYIDYLKDKNILLMEKNYLKGRNSRIYSLNEDVINSKILRYKNEDKTLLKKYIQKHKSYELDHNDIISREIKEQLIRDLHHVTIQTERSIFYLDSLRAEDIDIYNRNKYSVEAIDEKHIFYHFDSFGRMHTNFTILKSFIRKNCLLINSGETCEIDIKNSQPLFLSYLIKMSNTKWVDEDEFKFFYRLVRNGTYYQYLIDRLSLNGKAEAKELTYKVLFGRNRLTSRYDKMFIALFPTIHNFIRLYKNDYKDYRVMAYHLQKAESNLIYENIIRRIYEMDMGIRVITVHDSIIVEKQWKDTVNEIFEYEIQKHFDFL